MPLHPITRTSLPDAVFDQLSEEICHGGLPPGAPLPSERVLCAELGVNRGAVREALKRLAQAGLVAIRHGGPTRVLDFTKSAGLDLLARLLLRSDGSLDLSVGRSVLEMRSALGPEIAAQCARRRSDAVAEELERVLEEMKQAGDDLARLSELGMEYWQLLCKGSDNVAYQLACNTLHHTYDTIRSALLQAMAPELLDLERHRRITSAVREGDTEAAAQAARELLGRGERRIQHVLEALGRAQESRP
jgi:GntR family transcriptional repressor for pyruvate dehydrogenase complex